MNEPTLSLIELLFESEIIEIFYSIWIDDPINLKSLKIFTNIIMKHPDMKQFFIDKNLLPELLQTLQNYNKQENSIDDALIIIKVIEFLAEFFNNNSDCPIHEYALFIKEIIIVYKNSFLFKYEEDKCTEEATIVSLWEICILAMNNFALDEQQKARLLINFELPHPLFLDLNSRPLYRSIWPKALELILKLFRSNYEDLKELSEAYIDLSVFQNIIKQKSSPLIVTSALIFIELINIDPINFPILLLSSNTMSEIFQQVEDLSYKNFFHIMELYHKVFTNGFKQDRDLVCSKMLDIQIITKIVDNSEVENEPVVVEDLQNLFLTIYEIVSNSHSQFYNEEIQEILDQAFEDDGILCDFQRPLMI